MKWGLALGIPVAVAAVVGAVFLGGEDQPTPTVGVTCWDDTRALSAASCPTPMGFDGLATVFHSMDDSCERRAASADGKVELFECTYDNYTIRYSRWADDYDRYAYLDENVVGADTGEWSIDGVTAGRTWTGIDERTSEERRYRWIGAYENAPYDVTVKGVDEAGLEAGLQRVRAKQPDEIGLP